MIWNMTFVRFLTAALPCALMLAHPGCARSKVCLPCGRLPSAVPAVDSIASTAIEGVSPPEVERPKHDEHNPFDVLAPLPGADSAPFELPKPPPNATGKQLIDNLKTSYPKLDTKIVPLTDESLREFQLAELIEIAFANRPSIQRAIADSDAAYGRVIQAGLHPNPVVGYQADQWQPGPKPNPLNNSGQQGGFVSQLIKTAGKLQLAQQVAGFDYINSLIDVREEQIRTISEVRRHYFEVLVAEQAHSVSTSLATMAQELYEIQIAQVAAGISAPYEPLILYSQATQAKNSVSIAAAQYRSAWSQLAASIGQPSLEPAPIAGSAITEPPKFDPNDLQPMMLSFHTNVLQSLNRISQAQTDLELQRRIPIPDLQLNNSHQFDNSTSNYQFGVQVGIALPISDRNQGNIRAASSRITSNSRDLEAIRNDLQSRFAEAFARYEVNVLLSKSYRDSIIPNLTQGYQAIVRRYQSQPGAVTFNDVVVAQQNLAQSLQSYTDDLSAQWQAVIDVASIVQLDELYTEVLGNR